MEEKLPFIERDVSWLYFNGRVLQEAKDHSVPLYERIKFLAIYSSNLDEFFRVRVASLRSYRKLRKSLRREMELKPRKLLKKIRSIVEEQQNEFGRIFREEIIPELENNNIRLLQDIHFNESQIEFAKKYFKENIESEIKYTMLSEGNIPFLENRMLYLVVTFEEEEDLIIVKIPSENRFVELPKNDDSFPVTFVDDIVRVCLPMHFSTKKTTGTYSVKMSRDAEMYIDDEYSGDLLEKIKIGLKNRDVGLPTRFLYDASMPEELFKKIKSLFDLSKNDLVPGARYHNFSDFFKFPNPTNNPVLHDVKMPPVPHPELESISNFLNAISSKDYFLHFPYQKFEYVVRLIEEAANDPEVEYIKVTLYRVAGDSSVAKGLLHALENGKKVFAFIEAKARFDEASNMFWGNKLSEAGATVKYSFPGIKVHTKILVIGRKENESIRNYAYLATGNFNEKTAKLYSDFALLTARKEVAEGANQVMEMLEGKLLIPNTKAVMVAPHTLRTKLMSHINKEIKNAKAGNDAWMIVKLNSLEDEEVMAKLVEASHYGVKIKMIIRGICRLQPGLPGLTENIEIYSLVDRFLEHARVYIFASGGKEKMYMASADWMERNLSRRVEIAFPILDEDVKSSIRHIIDLQLNDNQKLRIIDADNLNQYKTRKKEERPLRSQAATYHYFEELASSNSEV